MISLMMIFFIKMFTDTEALYTARPGKNGPKFKKVISSLDMLLFEFLTRKK